MGLNKPFNRDFFLINGAVKTTGGSLHLAKGQLAAVDQTKATADGLKVISSFAGKAKDKKDFTIRLGIDGKTPGRSYSDKDKSTVPFSLDSIRGLAVSAPKITEHIVDEVVIGYDGTPGSEFKWKTGDSYFRLALKLTGGAIEYRGGKNAEEFIGINIEIPSCDPFNTCDTCDNCDAVDCKAIVLEAVERLRRKQLTGGKTVADFIDVTPVFECTNDIAANLIPFNFYTLELCDTGDDVAKAIVAAQYNVPVKRILRSGSISTYQLLAASAPADFSSTVASFIKGCDTCPAGYTAVTGGYVYAFTIEDDGVDKTALITAMANYSAGTVIKSGNDAGVGFYTAVFTAKITDAQIATLLGGAVPSNTFTVDLVGKIADLCDSNAAATTTAWTLGDTVNAVSEAYDLWLADGECGNDRLVELQGAYTNLTVALAQYRLLTLTGTSGTADINIGGTDYTATFATSLTQTAANFVTAHGATILANEGVKVTAALGVLTFENIGVALPTISIANDVSDLDGTLAAAVTYTAGCQTKYTTSVISNLVGEECDVIYKDAYITSAPESYENIDWTVSASEAAVSPSGNCKCGIRFKSRVFVLDAEEALYEEVGFLETSTKIQVAAGFPEEIREGIGSIPEGGYQGKYLSRQQHRTHLAGNLRKKEQEANAYFRGESPRSYLGKLLRGETTNLPNSTAQYIQYTLKVSNFNHTQGFAGRINDDIDYNFFVEIGRHNAIEDLLNNLAANAGVSPVQAFPI